MSLQSVNQYGASYKWGFQDSDAPTISGLKLRTAELVYEPEVNSEATDGEGHADAVTISKPNKHTINATFTGYAETSIDPNTLAQSFTFEGRFYIRGRYTEPRRKGDYWEISFEARSRANITS